MIPRHTSNLILRITFVLFSWLTENYENDRNKRVHHVIKWKYWNHPLPENYRYRDELGNCVKRLIISNVRYVKGVPTSSQQIDVSKFFESFKIVEENIYIDTIQSIGNDIWEKRMKPLRMPWCSDLEETIKVFENEIRAGPIVRERIWGHIIENQTKINLEYDSNIENKVIVSKWHFA